MAALVSAHPLLLYYLALFEKKILKISALEFWRAGIEIDLVSLICNLASVARCHHFLHSLAPTVSTPLSFLPSLLTSEIVRG